MAANPRKTGCRQRNAHRKQLFSRGTQLSFTDESRKKELKQSMVDLVTSLAKALVDQQDEVSVEAIDEPTSTLLRLRVSPADLGKVIGKQGRTARSIRTILAAASMKAQHRFALDIQQVGDAPGRVHPGADAED
jgi:predicted RNA-binding protein YlqC (UPF0109 family)